MDPLLGLARESVPLAQIGRQDSARKSNPAPLRASFASAVLSAGANSDCVQKYMGHAPTSVLTGHYAQISDEMLRAAILLAIEKWWHKSDILADPSSQIQSNHGLASDPR